MNDIRFPITESLKDNGVNLAGIINNEIRLDIGENILRASINQEDFLKTIKEIQYQLDTVITANRVKESILHFISKNYLQAMQCQPTSMFDLGKPEKDANDFETREVISIEEWQSSLEHSLFDLKSTVDRNFPNLWETLEFALAIRNILHIKECTLPFSGIILGPPSSMKTLAIELFRNTNNIFYSDNFSPKSFVSHSTSIKKEELAEVDLLPKLKNKFFLTPELGPIFSKKDEDLTELLGIIIRILDGHGYESDSGAQGHRGYNGKYMFSWMGAAVEIPKRVHKLLATLGPKLYFYRISRFKKSEDDLYKQITGKGFGEKKIEVQEKLQAYLNLFDKYPFDASTADEYHDYKDDQSNQLDKIIDKKDLLIKIDYDVSTDEEKAIRLIIKLAKLLSPLRGTLQTWETRDSQGAEYAYSLPIIEEPERAIIHLRNLARGHAFMYGRTSITMEDIPLLIKVVLSTASMERVKVLDLLLASDGELTTSQVVHALNVSSPTAKRTMVEFKGLGLVDMITEGEYENSEKSIRLKSEFSWFLGDEFKALREDFTPGYPASIGNYEEGAPKLLQEKTPLSYNISTSLEMAREQEQGGTKEAKLKEIEKDDEELYECYYCVGFVPTNAKKDYEQHIVLRHQGRLAYPSIADLQLHNLIPKGKPWE